MCNTKNIDEIISMLDSNNSNEIQLEGRVLAKNVKCINVFLKPKHAENIWKNCAFILAERTDEELSTYLSNLFEWLQDVNCQGSDIIYNRLMVYKDKNWFNSILEMCIHKAKVLNKKMWLDKLLEIKLEFNGKYNKTQCGIDEIMDMFALYDMPEVEARGIEMAKNVKCINAFLQPTYPGHNKNVWESCAKVLEKRTDAELHPYLYELFQWLQDMNWPGAEVIYNRLKKYKEREWFDYILKICINEAKALGDESWLDVLLEIKETF